MIRPSVPVPRTDRCCRCGVDLRLLGRLYYRKIHTNSDTRLGATPSVLNYVSPLALPPGLPFSAHRLFGGSADYICFRISSRDHVQRPWFVVASSRCRGVAGALVAFRGGGSKVAQTCAADEGRCRQMLTAVNVGLAKGIHPCPALFFPQPERGTT